ncbi:hypothetical protein KM043_013701 [Ampulex compressa]|nr:hypothetical protein KM043_013701 [Ampulex compressa]
MSVIQRVSFGGQGGSLSGQRSLYRLRQFAGSSGLDTAEVTTAPPMLAPAQLSTLQVCPSYVPPGNRCCQWTTKFAGDPGPAGESLGNHGYSKMCTGCDDTALLPDAKALSRTSEPSRALEFPKETG